MGRDKSRAHLHNLHRIDSNTEQQLEVLRQKLAQVGTENKCTNAMSITMPIVGHIGNNDHLLRGWMFITCVCVWRAGGQQFCRGGGGSFSDKGVLPGRSL